MESKDVISPDDPDRDIITTPPIHDHPLNETQVSNPDLDLDEPSSFGYLLPIDCSTFKNVEQIVCPTVVFKRGDSADGSLSSVVGQTQTIHLGANKLASAQHLIIERISLGRFRLTDSSTNGTWVNGEKITRGESRFLKKGDTFSLQKKKQKTVDESTPFPVTFVFMTDEVDSSLPVLSQTSTINTTNADDDEKSEDKTDHMKSELTCNICQEIMYNCVSVVPCLHSFCAPCLSGWLEQDNDSCPVCRKSMSYPVRNHKVRALIDAYLQSHPNEKRDPDEIADMEKTNTLTEDKLRETESKQRMGRRHHHSDDSDYSDSDDSSSGQVRNRQFGRAFAVPATRCRECTTPRADGFQCQQGGNHLFCFVCHQPFPDRTGQANVPPQKCELCQQAFCNLYWGCNGPNGRSSFKKLEDTEVVQLAPNAILNNNEETNRLIKIICVQKKSTIKDTFADIVSKLDSNDVTFGDTRDTLTGKALKKDTAVCFHCLQRVVNHLFLVYRTAIPKDDLPPEIKSLPDCYYGKNCRTQTHKAPHAVRFNHICDQTRQ
ncbi:putative E3 ubiquitin-protein ligase CHFR [Blattamonas nauphoetae]|uniref:E3 ubiquitin-protein ligase CHFR n=1 Tax=Blattamonas nauphoetae TaxID=2049346 RepID=A0ABQ9X9U0_9EUKA|nr:putative E3 ubiquitin-protein ligase CHFR [Blattamonas nauphoetae]